MERGLIQAATYGRGMYEINLSPGKAAADFDGDGKMEVENPNGTPKSRRVFVKK